MSIFGLETEYSVHLKKKIGEHRRGEALGRGVHDTWSQMHHDAGKSVVQSGGHLWFGNGGCCYIDCGHPEYATPECGSPEDLVKQMCIGDRLLERASTDIYATKSNMDSNGKAWGSHESYMCDPSGKATGDRHRALIPHLVTRILYTGAGGFMVKQGRKVIENKTKFLISPRSQVITRTSGSNTTGNRGIINTRDEPHSAEFGRQHLVCGESLCSHLSTYLRFGTTALVIAMADAGIMPKCAIKSPVIALRGLSANMNYKISLYSKKSSAISIQQKYLDLAKKYKDADFMPPWAGEVCEEWDKALKLLRKGWEAVSDRFDWAIKYRIFRDYLKSKGEKLNILKGKESSIEVASKLREIDVKFSELGKGIFYNLDKAGMLKHRMWSNIQISRSLYTAPQNSRAKQRGKFVNGLPKGAYASISWSCALTCRGSKVKILNMSDPRKGEEIRMVKKYKRGMNVKLNKPNKAWEGWERRFDAYVGKVATVMSTYSTHREVHVQIILEKEDKYPDEFMWPVESVEEAS